MNETTPFFQSNGFWLCLGLVVGAIVGFFTYAFCAISGQASRDEEQLEYQAEVNKATSEVEKAFDKIGIPLHKGKPDRE
jgi:uncharacterized membrane-anchored protein YhcB (DUF1043 family)